MDPIIRIGGFLGNIEKDVKKVKKVTRVTSGGTGITSGLNGRGIFNRQ
jgi:hypothetical protein